MTEGHERASRLAPQRCSYVCTASDERFGHPLPHKLQGSAPLSKSAKATFVKVECDVRTAIFDLRFQLVDAPRLRSADQSDLGA